MKKLCIALSMLAVITAVPVFAADTSSTQIVAIVGKSVSITGTLPTSTSIDVTATSTGLGTVTIVSNTTGSWKITITSTNGGYMLGDASASHYLYTVDFGTVLTGVSLASPQVVTVTGTGTLTYALKANYTPAATYTPTLVADTYRDSIMISVAAL
jgi:hypothetical protein